VLARRRVIPLRLWGDWSMLLAVSLRYGAAIVVLVLTLFTWKVLLRPLSPDPYPLLLAAVVFSAFYGGLGAGLLTSVFAALGSLYLYPHHGTQLDVFLVLAGFLTWLCAPLPRALDELRRNIHFTKSITRSLSEGICVLDQRGRVTFINPSAELMLGWSARELRGADAQKVVWQKPEGQSNRSPEDLPLLRKLRSGSSTSDEEGTFVRKDGTLLPVSYVASPIARKERVEGAVIAFRDVTSRKQAVEALQEGEERYRGLVEHSPDCIVVSDLYGFITIANERAAEVYGYDDPEDIVGLNAGDLIAPEDRQRAMQERQKTAQDRSARHGEYLSLRKSGTPFPTEISFSLLLSGDGEPDGIASFIRDVSDRKQSEDVLHTKEARLAMQYAATQVLSEAASVDEAIWKCLQRICDAAHWDVGMYWSVDQRQNALRCTDVWHPPWISIPEFAHLSRQVAFSPGDGLPGRVWHSGQPEWIDDVVTTHGFSRAVMASKEKLHGAFCFPVKGAKTVHGVVELFSMQTRDPQPDLAEAMATMGAQIGQFVDRRQAEEALEHQAMYDPLTDLPNRRLLVDRLQQAIRGAHRTHSPVALLLLDLDGFKEINDTLGYDSGDVVLREAGVRLRHTLRESDTVARLDGDEFAVVLPSADETGAALAAEKVREALRFPFVLEGQSLDVGVSVGVAVYPAHGEDAVTLLRRAELAVNVAKEEQDRFAVYTPRLDDHSPARSALMSELRQALDRGELLLHYQPKVDLKTGRVESAEALVRWQHAEHGLLPPDEFVHLAEHAGLIHVLSLQVLSTALRQCRVWHTKGLDARVAVNLPPRALDDQQLVSMTAGLLRTCQAESGWLELEIAESAVLSNPERALDVLSRLRELGVRVSLDRCLGRSGLASLKQVPADEIKIDKSLVLDIATNGDAVSVVRTIIDQGHHVGLKVAAEGVETADMREMLAEMDCDLAQGSHLGGPLRADELADRYGGTSSRLTDAS